MEDTKRIRDQQAQNAEDQQRDQEGHRTRDRAAETASDGGQDDLTGIQRENGDSRECHRRGCTRSARFVVLERYQEETGHGAVEAEAVLCREHTAEESPTNLDSAYSDYVFHVEPFSQER